MTVETLIWGLKFVHIGAIGLWVGGLLAMPYLIWQRHGLREARGSEAVHHLHRTVRALHVGLVSPAAFTAIAAGIPLIFLRQTFDLWFTVKLAFVGLLVLAHHMANAASIRVFADDPKAGDPDEAAHRDRVHRLSGPQALMLGLTVAVASTGVLVMVLAKPSLDLRGVAPGVLRPGGLGPVAGPVLRPIIDRISPWWTP